MNGTTKILVSRTSKKFIEAIPVFTENSQRNIQHLKIVNQEKVSTNT